MCVRLRVRDFTDALLLVCRVAVAATVESRTDANIYTATNTYKNGVRVAAARVTG